MCTKLAESHHNLSFLVIIVEGVLRALLTISASNMLSQVKRRLLYPIIFENAFIAPSVSRFSSKKGPKEPFVSAQVPEEEKELSNAIFENNVFSKKPVNKSSDKHSAVFDAVLKASFATKKKAGDAKKGQASKARPGQLNLQMVKAAHSVADMAGDKKEDVLDDIMGKLDTVFPGMENHVKGKRKAGGMDRKPFAKEGSTSRSAEDAMDLSDVIGDAFNQMSPPKRFSTERSSSQYYRPSSSPRPMKGERFTSIDKLLKDQKPLGIFTSKLTSESSLTMWNTFEKDQIDRLTKFEPMNWFDQCVRWTEEGKLWHFPIDNEQGMDEEAEVDFSEHIFLEHHADSWCPQEGPIKYFMELVLVGLSKNPYLTVQEKIDTINWYRDYFKANQTLLEEINAFGSPENPIEVEGKMS